ncbi:MAG TPA: DUF2207 domain-containing protein [bacterium]|nr:DUF2207 domain-containing protein [bacterium]
MRRPSVARWGASIGAVILFVLALTAPLQARSITIQSFDADIAIHADGHIVVAEKIRIYFEGSWNGIIRSIPVKYRTPQGFNFDLDLKAVTITDESGNALKFERSRARHYLEFKIWVPGASDAARTIVLTYRVDNALTFFEDHDELYWNITGDEWEMPIEAATARIRLPDAATGLRAVAFTGAYGSRALDATVEKAGQMVTMRMNRALDFREGLTAVVGWDKGFVAEPTALDKTGSFLAANWPIAVPIFVVFPLMFWLWHTRGRDPELRPIAVQYEPPAGLSPGEVGTLVDDSPDMRDITATLIHLATRGYIAIEEKNEEKFFGLIDSKDYSFQALKPVNEWGTLAAHEWALMNGIFDTGEVNFVPLDNLKNKFYAHIPKIRDRLFDGLMQRGFYKARPDRVKAGYVVSGVLLGALMAGFGGAAAERFGIAPFAAVLGGILTGLIIVGFGLIMPARTRKGAEALEGVLGFQEFLRKVEGPRFSRADLRPDMFEKFLPYAMALGVEANWAKAFEGIAEMSPSWYRGATPGGIFHPAAFTSRLGAMSTTATSVMSSAPRGRSGGSGFGGGGFSGGGGGGGGGRGF